MDGNHKKIKKNVFFQCDIKVLMISFKFCRQPVDMLFIFSLSDFGNNI